ncbi:hypothetical protein M2390_001154 [Mycetocola sp. BIGb0189]|uniref:hypothetical protein n=1 Tax=Mycetocola sp. BIGb0189 TaxID=2940604 RepID=UPI002167A625|nr:hypothetical protein [Mycetocola sp. BIGb0189]MCS4275982.1 hypothetical protein [Mycetocola sp. BIGb0189]
MPKSSHSRKKIARRLSRSLTECIPVEIVDRFSDGETRTGLVLALGEDWILLQSIRDAGFYDGYAILRRKDIRRVRLRDTFVPYLREHREWPPPLPAGEINLASAATILADVARIASVFVFAEEWRRPGAVWLGTPVEWDARAMWIVMINPDCTWEDGAREALFTNLTRVEFDDDYSRAVHAVAGPMPAWGSEPSEDPASV